MASQAFKNQLILFIKSNKSNASQQKMKTPPINTKIINTLPVFLSCLIAALLVYWQNWTHYSPALFLGIIAGGLVDLDNGLTGKFKNLLFTLVAFTISSLSVQLSFHHTVALTVVLTTQAFVFTFIGAAGVRFRTIAFGTLAVAIYTILTHDPSAPLYLNSLLILFGTLLYSGMAMLTHIVFPHRPVQENMALAYDSLARYLNAKAEFFNPDEIAQLSQQQTHLAMLNSQVIAQFNQCRSALFYRMRGQHRHPRTTKMLHYYFIAQDIHERISSSHVNYHDFAEQMRHTDLIFRIRWLLTQQAHACRDVAQALRDNRDYQADPKLERATQGAQQSLDYYEHDHATDHQITRLLDNITSVSNQFAHLGSPHCEWQNVSDEHSRLLPTETGHWRDVWRSLKQHATFQSGVFRHAVRMAITTLVCCIIIQLMKLLPFAHNDLSLGYWILLTAAFVCQPNYSATESRVFQRIAGTIAGVLVGSALPLLSVNLADKLFIVAASTVLFFFFRTNKYSFSTFFITIQALTGFSIMGHDITNFFIPRALDTIIGAGVAGVAVDNLWAGWKYVSLERTATQAIQSNGGYLQAVIQSLRGGWDGNHLDYRVARRNSHDKAAALSSVLSDMSGEVRKHGHQLDDGFLLLNTNYSLISHIAALGAYREQIQQTVQDEVFFNGFYAAAEQTALLLKNMDNNDAETFQQAYGSLKQQLKTLREHLQKPACQSPQNLILWQQLHRIAELLLPCYQALHTKKAA